MSLAGRNSQHQTEEAGMQWQQAQKGMESVLSLKAAAHHVKIAFEYNDGCEIVHVRANTHTRTHSAANKKANGFCTRRSFSFIIYGHLYVTYACFCGTGTVFV